jgi:hypothetical protein
VLAGRSPQLLEELGVVGDVQEQPEDVFDRVVAHVPTPEPPANAARKYRPDPGRRGERHERFRA